MQYDIKRGFGGRPAMPAWPAGQILFVEGPRPAPPAPNCFSYWLGLPGSEDRSMQIERLSQERQMQGYYQLTTPVSDCSIGRSDRTGCFTQSFDFNISFNLDRSS